MVSRTEAARTSAFIGKLDMHKPRALALEFVQTLMTLLAVLVQLNKI